jgi:hypothetical protein
VRNDNERVRLEMEILKYRNFLLFIEDGKVPTGREGKDRGVGEQAQCDRRIGRLSPWCSTKNFDVARTAFGVWDKRSRIFKLPDDAPGEFSS